MVKDLIAITPLCGLVLDAGSGKNKVWYKNISDDLEKYECELEDGNDFYAWYKKVNWVIGNPPFHEGWKFLEKASQVSTDGIAFLGNLNFWNSCLPNRFEILKDKGFYLNKIHIVQDNRWFGRYYYLIFTKIKNQMITWNCKTY
jgi:hypothetical protein